VKRLLVRLALPIICILGRALFALGRAARRRRSAGPGPRKVLVMKLWAIGEVVMATPVLEALKRHDPRAEVHVLVGNASLAVVERNPFCDRAICVDESILLGIKPWGIFSLIRRLRRERYDTAVVLHHLFVFGLLACVAGIPVRTGIDRRGEGFALTVRVPRPSPRTSRRLRRVPTPPIDSSHRWIGCLPVRAAARTQAGERGAPNAARTVITPTHRTVEYLSTVAALGVDTSGLRPLVKVGPEDTARAASLLRQFGMSGGERRLVGMLPTGGANAAASKVRSNIVNKRWPVEYYVDLASRLAEMGCDVLILGGLAETRLRPAFQRVAGPRVRVLLGGTSLATSAAIMKRCDAVVTNDSGPMHVADAVGARLVAVFGPTDPRIVSPYGQPGSVLRSGEKCSPCFDESVFPNRMAECDHQRCMRNVKVDEVLAAVTEALQRGRPERSRNTCRPADVKDSARALPVPCA